MRFTLVLELISNNSKNSLPINYQYELSSFVYHTLARADEQYTWWLHENGFTVDKKQFRLFSFSSFEIPTYKIEADRIIIDSDKIKWYISFLPEKSTEHFIQGLFNNIEFSIGDSKSKVNFRVSSVEMTNTELAYEILNFQTLSPVCITRHDPLQKQVIYENPDSEYASEALFLNLKNKYKAYFGHEYEGESTFEFKLLSKPQSKLITIKTNTPEQSRVKGFKFKFSLKADPQLMQIMYHCGLGEKNAMGFGFVELNKNAK
jgi:CRISPR-associated endoribonuclease Cas6